MRISDRGAMLLCVTGMAIVGSSVAISQLLLDYPILTAQAVRYGLAAVVLFALVPRFSAVPTRPTRSVRPTRREWLVLGLLAATGLAGFNACVMIALGHADPAVVGTVIGSAPIGLALLGPLLHGGRPAPRLVVAAAVVVLGTALVHGSGRTDGLGVFAALGALVGEIAFSLLAAAVLPRLGPVRVAAYSCALAVPLLLFGAALTGEPARWRLPTPVEAATIGYLAALMTVVAFLVWFTGLRRLGVARAAVITGVMPVATLATAAVQAGRLPDPGQAIGVLVVALGLAVGLARAARSGVAGRHRSAQEVDDDAERSAARTASA